jgi:hypothetical protein
MLYNSQSQQRNGDLPKTLDKTSKHWIKIRHKLKDQDQRSIDNGNMAIDQEWSKMAQKRQVLISA